MMLVTSCTYTIALAAGIAWASVLPRAHTTARAPTGNFSLYAYGNSIFGSRLYYVDSEAYVAPTGAPISDNQATNVTFNFKDTSLSALPDVGTWSSTPVLSIPSTSDEAAAVTFVKADSTSENTTSFGFYSQWLYHLASDGIFEMKFYASATNDTGVYKVMWAESDSVDADTNITYVSLRTSPPTDADASTAY